MNRIKTKNLFSVDSPLLLNLFENSEYPWEILPKIKEVINQLIANPPKGYTLYKEGVLIGENVVISETATIIPPAVIGSGTEVRHCAFIRGNVITLNDCVIGNSSELKNAVLLNKVQVPHYNYVGDSILGNFSHLGAGSICSNLKSDKKPVVVKGENYKIESNLRKFGAILGDGADVGCGSVLNPGTVIGKNSRIYPLTSVRGVIPENSIVKSMNNIVKIEV